MKSKIKRIKSEKKELVFPRLMQGNSTKDLVVLFVDKSNGTVVHDGERNNIGYVSEYWKYCDFTDFDGKVTLSN